jgi:hypothetical protein
MAMIACIAALPALHWSGLDNSLRNVPCTVCVARWCWSAGAAARHLFGHGCRGVTTVSICQRRCMPLICFERRVRQLDVHNLIGNRSKSLMRSLSMPGLMAPPPAVRQSHNTTVFSSYLSSEGLGEGLYLSLHVGFSRMCFTVT